MLKLFTLIKLANVGFSYIVYLMINYLERYNTLSQCVSQRNNSLDKEIINLSGSKAIIARKNDIFLL